MSSFLWLYSLRPHLERYLETCFHLFRWKSGRRFLWSCFGHGFSSWVTWISSPDWWCHLLSRYCLSRFIMQTREVEQSWDCKNLPLLRDQPRVLAAQVFAAWASDHWKSAHFASVHEAKSLSLVECPPDFHIVASLTSEQASSWSTDCWLGTQRAFTTLIRHF